MTTEVRVADAVFEDGQESVIGTWMYADGEQVSQGAIIAEVMTEKVAHELQAPAAGTLRHLVVEEERIERGQVIARIE